MLTCDAILLRAVISQPESLELEELRLETDELAEQNSQLSTSTHAAEQERPTES
jgi:hypothetical protein